MSCTSNAISFYFSVFMRPLGLRGRSSNQCYVIIKGSVPMAMVTNREQIIALDSNHIAYKQTILHE